MIVKNDKSVFLNVIFLEELIEENVDSLSSYTEQRLQSIAHDQIWKGKGTEKDPFIVQNANILGQAITLTKSSLYLSFINCNFNHAQFEDCKNIFLKNCTFNNLILKKCMKFKIENSFITNLSFSRIKFIEFIKSIIFNVFSKFRIKNTVFKDCQINNDFLDYILKKSNSGFYSKIKEIITAFIIILSLTLFYRSFFMFYVFNYSEIANILLYFIIIIALVAILLFSLLYEYLVIKKHPKIKILSTRSG